MPRGCGEGAELLVDGMFTGSAKPGVGWGTYSWKVGGAKVGFGATGATVQVSEHQPAQKYDALFYQQVKLEASSAGSYELCVEAGAQEAGNVLRFAVDGDSALEYAVAGGGERALLQLPPGSLSVGCFSFQLPATGGTYAGRVTVEFGDASSEVAVCQASLRKCVPRATPAMDIPPAMDMPPAMDSPRAMDEPPTSACPATPTALDSWSCPLENLGEELLGNSVFSGASPQGEWNQYMWQAGAANFTFGGPAGVLVDVRQQSSKPEPFDVQLWRNVHLGTANSSSFELCVQAGAAKEGAKIRFAVDSGDPGFVVPGMLERHVMDLPVGSLAVSCFKFALHQSATGYTGRVDLELGANSGALSVCQVSLRSCRTDSYIPDGLMPVRRCYLSPLEGGVGGCKKVLVFEGKEFGLNDLGQETDGKRACLQKTRSSDGNSFVFTVGKCEVWFCPNREAILASATGDEATGAVVYSELCEYQEPTGGRRGEVVRSPVFVKLWEWNFKDVARECEDFLGPNGFDAVQVPPITEHILGGAWFAKYQPVSFLLNSRSGTVEDFKCMVATCRAAGVEVIVDVVLNHIAKPCDAVREVGSDAVTPCFGWAGSRFGNRRLAAGGGFPPAGPEDFHHLRKERLVNCAVQKDTFKCPESDPPDDCTQCDLFGLPDWDTNLPVVQDILARHLAELHSIGVTMIRLDAASYMNPKDLSLIVNQLPWDYVFQEWWEGIPAPDRTRYVGNYRDIFYVQNLNRVLAVGNLSKLTDLPKLTDLLDITSGLEGIEPAQAVYPLTFHDRRTLQPDMATPTYKNGLAFHQLQKFMLASPAGVVVRLWGGFGWTNLDDGPPGCRHTDVKCQPMSVFNDQGEAQCIPTPVQTPLDKGLAESHRWACEHRWAGTAGLLDFRKACRGLSVTQTWDAEVDKGNLAFRTGDRCFVALQRKLPPLHQRMGDWSLQGFYIGLPAGRYCDLASLPTKKDWEGLHCPREVIVGSDGMVQRGVVLEGDLTAIHVGMRLPIAPSALQARQPRTVPDSVRYVCGATQHLSGAGTLRPAWWLGSALAGLLLAALQVGPHAAAAEDAAAAAA